MIDPCPSVLDDGDRRELLRIARITLKEWLKTGRLPPGAPHRASLLAPAPAFVTLHVGGVLRGCTGRIDAEGPLYRTISDMAVRAAAHDPRREKLRLEELPDTRITIAVLSARRAVRDPAEVEVGQHGVVVTRGAQRGLLLPHVAVENDWSRERLLAEACRTADLPGDAWREAGTCIETFTADVFSEPS